jgi:hypothetical protein
VSDDWRPTFFGGCSGVIAMFGLAYTAIQAFPKAPPLWSNPLWIWGISVAIFFIFLGLYEFFGPRVGLPKPPPATEENRIVWRWIMGATFAVAFGPVFVILAFQTGVVSWLIRLLADVSKIPSWMIIVVIAAVLAIVVAKLLKPLANRIAAWWRSQKLAPVRASLSVVLPPATLRATGTLETVHRRIVEPPKDTEAQQGPASPQPFSLENLRQFLRVRDSQHPNTIWRERTNLPSAAGPLMPIVFGNAPGAEEYDAETVAIYNRDFASGAKTFREYFTEGYFDPKLDEIIANGNAGNVFTIRAVLRYLEALNKRSLLG